MMKIYINPIHLVLCCYSLTILATTQIAMADDNHAIGKGANELPIFDAHIHYKEPAWDAYPPNKVIQLMDNSGVAMGLVSSTPDEGTIKLWEYAPNRIVPELRPYYGIANSSNWMKVPGMKGYLESRLDKYPHKGIGEFHIRSIDKSDEAMFRTVTQMAKKRNLPLHIHSGAEPVEWLYELEPALTIIWAHAGMSEPPEVIDAMFTKYKTLYADTSFREMDILNDARTGLNPEWAELIHKFPERLMIGTDTWVNSQWDDYEGLISINRQWLSFLPENIARMIAYQNAEKFFKRTVSKKLIGTR